MSVLIDTGVLVGYVHKADKHHARARALVDRLLEGTLGAALSSDYVLDEGLTLLRKNPGRRDVSEAFRDLMHGRGAVLRRVATDEPTLDAALDLHFKMFDRGLSVTDCTLIAHAKRIGAKVATFDSEFHGVVPVVSD